MPAACIVLPHIWNVGRVPNFIWSQCYDFSNSFLSKSKPQVFAASVKVLLDRFFLSLENYASLAQTYVTLDAVLFIVLLIPYWLEYNVYKNSFCCPIDFWSPIKTDFRVCCNFQLQGWNNLQSEQKNVLF